MGLFIVPKSDKNEDLINAAIGNLKLYLELIEKDKNYDNSYLLEFAFTQLELVREKLNND